MTSLDQDPPVRVGWLWPAVYPAPLCGKKTGACLTFTPLHNRELKQGQQERQPQGHKTIGLMKKKKTTLHAFHVRFTCWHISLPSFAKQHREMIKINGLWRTSVHDDKHFILSPNAAHISFILANCHVLKSVGIIGK